MSDPRLLFDPDSTTDLIAFEVEGSGYYLVPLAALVRFEVHLPTARKAAAPLGWGWALPVVRWNTFHTTQLDAEISLGPMVTARLAAHHFVPASSTPTNTTSAPGTTGADRQGSTTP